MDMSSLGHYGLIPAAADPAGSHGAVGCGSRGHASLQQQLAALQQQLGHAVTPRLADGADADAMPVRALWRTPWAGAPPSAAGAWHQGLTTR